MDLYVVRTSARASLQDLEAGGAMSVRITNEELSHQVRWIRSC